MLRKRKKSMEDCDLLNNNKYSWNCMKKKHCENGSFKELLRLLLMPEDTKNILEIFGNLYASFYQNLPDIWYRHKSISMKVNSHTGC